MRLELPPPRHRNWLVCGVFGAVGSALLLITITRWITGQGFGSLADLLQAWVAGSLLFLVYFGTLAMAGFFGFLIMVKTMLVGFGIASLALFFFAWRDNNTGWGGIAAIAAFLEISVFAIVGGAFAEMGTYLLRRRKIDATQLQYGFLNSICIVLNTRILYNFNQGGDAYVKQ